jgi:predicted nucleic acid-binding protein
MVTLVLDTNIWLYLAKGEHPIVLQKLLEKFDRKEIEFLVSSLQISEWRRNKGSIIKQIRDAIQFQIQNAQTISEYLEGDEKTAFTKSLVDFKNSEPRLVETAEKRFELIEDILTNKSSIAIVTNEDKIEVANWAIEKKAPFHRNNNSYADALIILSTVKYVQKNSPHTSPYEGKSNKIIVPDSVFVSYNSDDFSKDLKGADKDLIHPDLEPLLNSVHMRFERNIGKVLTLSEALQIEIDKYWEYINDLIDSQIEWQSEIMRGK